jgi:hypothetical protein
MDIAVSNKEPVCTNPPIIELPHLSFMLILPDTLILIPGHVPSLLRATFSVCTDGR